MSALAPLPLLVALMLAAAANEQAQVGDYAFSLDGHPFLPRIQYLNGSPGHPAPGDVIEVDGMSLTLGPERSLRFRTAPDREGVLQEAEGATRWVGVRIAGDWSKHGDLRDPLADLSPDQVRGLWGLSAEEWTASCVAKARWLDVDRTYLAVGQSASATGLDLPALPTGLRYLEAGKFRGWSSLALLSRLEVLSLIPERPLDARTLKGLTRLRSLVFYGDASHLQGLSYLTALQHLDLRHKRSARNVDFASGLTALQSLNVSSTRVEDLRPLSGLPNIRQISASASAVRLLPEGPLPALEEVELIGAAVPEVDVQRFRARHPKARVRSRWNDALQEAIAAATTVRVTSGEQCALEGTSVTPVDITDSREVARAAALLRVVERDDVFSVCGCLSGPEIEFRRADDLLASVSSVCGDSARWEGWPADAPLFDAPALREWLASHGLTGPRDEAREGLARAAAFERLTQRAVSGMSDALKEAFLKDLERARRVLESRDYPVFRERLEDLPQASDRIAVLLRVLGADNGSWSSYGPQAELANTLLRRYPRAELERAVLNALMGADRQRRRGAARLWLSWRSPPERWQPAARDDARRILLGIMQESPTASVRQDAVRREGVVGRHLRRRPRAAPRCSPARSCRRRSSRSDACRWANGRGLGRRHAAPIPAPAGR